MTLAELKTLIQNYTENTETTFVNTLDDFIKNAEERIFELIQFDYFRKNVTGTLTTGNTYLTAPTDYQLSFSLAIIDSGGDYHYLDKKHVTFMREYSVDPTDSTARGRPLYYADFDKDLSTASNNGSTLIVSPVPDADYNVELHYLFKPNSLVTFMKGENDLLQQYEQRFTNEISRLKNLAEARGRRDEYRYDSLRSTVT